MRKGPRSAYDEWSLVTKKNILY